MLLANWDLKSVEQPRLRGRRCLGAAAPPVTSCAIWAPRSARPGSIRFFALLGTRGQQGTKNDLAGFERRGFITEVDGNRVEFDYRGLNEELLRDRDPGRRGVGVRSSWRG